MELSFAMNGAAWRSTPGQNGRTRLNGTSIPRYGQQFVNCRTIGRWCSLRRGSWAGSSRGRRRGSNVAAGWLSQLWRAADPSCVVSARSCVATEKWFWQPVARDGTALRFACGSLRNDRDAHFGGGRGGRARLGARLRRAAG